MPPNKLKTDELIEALLDQKVVEALGKAIGPIIAQSVDDILGRKLSDLTTAIRDLKQENQRLTRRCDDLTAQNTVLRTQLDDQETRLEDLENYSRASNLIIRGLPESSYAERASGSADALSSESHTSVEHSIIKLCTDTLHVNVRASDIAIAHRLKAGARDTCRPVIVRFVNRRVRDEVFRSKKSLKDSSTRGIYISEHLTKKASNIFFEARKLVKEKKLSSAWTFHGVVNVKFGTDPGERPKTIRTIDELRASRPRQ